MSKQSPRQPDDERPTPPSVSRKPVRPKQNSMDVLADVPDLFADLWQKIASKALAYFGRAVLISVGGILAFSLAWGVGKWMESRREKATEALGKVLRTAEAPLLTGDQTADADEDPPRFKTEAERTAAVVKLLDGLDKDYGSSDAARRGALLRAGILYDQAKYSEAEAIYRKVMEQSGDNGPIVSLANEGLGLAAEARSDLPGALGAFERQAKQPFDETRARMNQARILLKQGSKDKALAIYQDLLAKAAATSPLREDIQNRLASLEP